MEEFLVALEKNVDDENWYSAVFLALTLPDICGKIEHPGKGSKERYTLWFKCYVEPGYTVKMPQQSEPIVFLSAPDCYALRCALLHAGVDEMERKGSREALERIHFTFPPKGGYIHLIMHGGVLQLQVDEFSRDIVASVRQWLKNVKDDPDKQAKLSGLMKVHGAFAPVNLPEAK